MKGQVVHGVDQIGIAVLGENGTCLVSWWRDYGVRQEAPQAFCQFEFAAL